jgi:hypothetical protein
MITDCKANCCIGLAFAWAGLRSALPGGMNVVLVDAQDAPRRRRR